MWSGYRHSPVLNEGGHLASGVYHLQVGKFDLYRVNPPLIRTVAAIPVVLCNPNTDWSYVTSDHKIRYEYRAGIEFYDENRDNALYYTTIARWACIPFSILGGAICWLWSRKLFGATSGLIAAMLWCFSPLVLGHASLLTPDAHAASLGIVAFYLFYRWTNKLTWWNAFFAGIVLGIAQLSKTSLLLFYPLFLFLWIFSRIGDKKNNSQSISWKVSATQFLFLFALSIYVINAGYLFNGSCTPLGHYRFRSQVLSGNPQSMNTEGNCFSGTIFSSIPVPLPSDYVYGIDRQKMDFEPDRQVPLPSYLCGTWKDSGGWWYFYIVAALVKTPLALFGLMLLAICCFFKKNLGWQNELFLLVPPLTFFVFISSQSQMTIHYRYIFPTIPFVLIFTSRVGSFCQKNNRYFTCLVAGLLAWFIGSSLYVFPHSLSYFNEAVGGPKNGVKYLLDSNIAWNQDLIYVKRWKDVHPDASPFFLVSIGLFDPEMLGLTEDMDKFNHPSSKTVASLTPGWYAIDVNQLYGDFYLIPHDIWRDEKRDHHNIFSFLRNRKPDAMIGYSIYVFHLTKDDLPRRHDEKRIASP